MGLVIYFCFTWLIFVLYLTFPLHLQKRENVFLFMFVLAINISISWILGEELEWLKLSDKVPEYLAFLLYRSVLLPFMILYFLNLLVASRSLWMRGVLILAYISTFFLLDELAYYYNVYAFSNRILIGLLLYYCFLLVAAAISLRRYRAVFKEKGV